MEDEGITFPSLSRTVINNMAAREEASDICVIVKWSGKEYPIAHLSPSETVRYLKDLIKEKTGVLPERQKLLGLKFKGILKSSMLVRAIFFMLMKLNLFCRRRVCL